MSIFANYRVKGILSPGLASLYTSRTIVLIAMGFVGMFGPVFFLIKYQSLEKTIWFYLVAWIMYLFLAAPGAKIMNHLGIKGTLILSLPFLALFYLCLYFFDNNLLLFSIMAMIALTIYRMCYWVPYHTNFTRFSEGHKRGKQLGLLDSLATFLGIIIPFASGFLIKEFGFNLVFVISIILVLIAIIPLLFLPEVKEKFSWSYKRTWQEFFSKKNRQMMVAYMGDGAENWIGGVLWPIFIWQLLEGEFLTIGIITSLITFVAVILKLIVGDYTDRFNKRKLMHLGSALYSLGWIIKMFISTAFHIFLASTYHNFAYILLRTPFDALMYEKAADSGHYIDEYSTLREMYLQVGRIIVMIVILILLKFVPLYLVFVLAAISSLLVNLLPKHGLHETASLR